MVRVRVLVHARGDGLRTFLPKGWLAIAKLITLSLFISLLLMPNEAFDSVKIET